MDTLPQGTPARRRPGRPRKADSGDTKAEITRAAVRLFARHGFTGTSTRAIAREVGLSESALYAHFTSKQALFEAALARFGPQGSTDSHTAIASMLAETDPPRFLAKMVSDFLERWDREEARLLISLVTRDGLMHSDALRTALVGMRAYVTSLFDDWLAAGWLPAHLGPAERLAFSFTGPIGLARVMHLHADATPEERTQARADVLQHVELFTSVTFNADHKE